MGQEIIECPNGLAQCAGTLVRTKRVVIGCLFGYCRRDLISSCGLVRELRLLRLTELHIGVSHRQACRLGEGVLLLLHLLKRTHSRFVLTQLVLGGTEHEHIASEQFLFVLRCRLAV